MADEPQQKDTTFYRWFLIIFSIFIFVLCIINAVNYNKILNQYNSQPDVEQDVGRGWARALYGLNITLAVVSGLVWAYHLWKVISGTDFSLTEKVKSWFSSEKTLEKIKADFIAKGGKENEFDSAVNEIKKSAELNDAVIRTLASIPQDPDKCQSCVKFLIKKYSAIKKNAPKVEASS